MLRLPTRLVPLASVLALALACGDGDPVPPGSNPDAGPGGPSADAGSTGPVEGCLRDPALIASQPACRIDDYCPCGTHCEFGLCVASCQTDDECAAGEACDDFGRCRSAEMSGRIAPVRAEVKASLRATPAFIEVFERDAPYYVRILPDGAGGAARVVARGSVRLLCPDSEDRATSCSLDAVPADGVEIGVLYTGVLGAAADEDLSPSVIVYDASGGALAIALQPTVAPEPAPLDGEYDGFAWIEVPGGTGALRVEAPIRAEVYDASGRATLALYDTTGSLFGASPMVLEATKVMGSTITAALPRFVRYAATSAEGDVAEVFVDASTGRGVLGAGTLQLRFDVRVFGLDLPGNGVPRQLVVAVTRTGARTEGPTPPPLTTDATTTPDPGRYNQISRRLDAAFDATAPVDRQYPPADRAPLSTTTDEDASLSGCFADPIRRQRALDGVRRDWVDACTSLVSLPTGYVMTAPVTCDPPGIASYCSFAFAGFEGSGSGGPPPFPGTLDVCGDMAAQYGCTPEPVTTTGPVLSVRYTQTAAPFWIMAYRPTQLCRFPDQFVAPAPDKCIETLACFDPAAPGARHAFGALSTVSGAPTCASGDAGLTFGALEQADPDPDALLTQCTQDILRSVTARPLGGQFATAGCVDRGRFLLRLEHAIDGFRNDIVAPVEQRTAHRLVQQWLQVHALVARLAENRMQQDLALATSGDPSTPAAEALATSLTVWDTTLQSWVTGSLRSLSAEVLRTPDLRADYGYDATGLPADATVGVSVDLLDTVAQQLELADALLARAWLEGDAATEQVRLQTAGEVLRIAAEVGPLAELLYLRAGGDTVPWQAAWKRAAPRFRLAVGRLAERIEQIKSDVNPLGIEASDLPLFVRGDPTSARARFSASTQFLVGDRPGAMAPAWLAVDRARTALEAARATFLERRRVSDQVEQRIQDIRFRYGELITGYCGASLDNDTNYANDRQPACLNPNSDSVFDCAAIDTEVCFVEEACRPRADAFLEVTTTAQLGYDLCVANELRKQYGANLIGLDAGLEAALTALGPDLQSATSNETAFPFRITQLQRSGANGRTATVRGTAGDVIVPLDAFGALEVRVPERARRTRSGGTQAETEPLLTRLAAVCDVPRHKSLRARPNVAPTTCTLADDCARGQACRNSTCTARTVADPLDKVDCYYDGAISEQAIAVRAAAQDIAIARAELDEFSERYDVAKRSCLFLESGQDLLEREIGRHNELMDDLSIARAAATSVEAYGSNAKDCSNSLGSVTHPLGVLTAGSACGTGYLEFGAKVAGAVIEQMTGEAERKHEATMLRIENRTELAICFNDAEMELVGARAAAMRIARAQQDQAIAVLNLRGQKSYTQALFEEGNAAIAQERARLERSLPSQFVVSEAAELYTQRMAYAQRISYLAVRAAEYEFQASLGARQSVLAAYSPNDLEEALRTVTAFLDNGRVAGASPASLLSVISLREHLLQLGDRSGDPNGQLGLTAEERFQRLLTSGRYAAYDDAGEYIGQRIPFSIHPLGTLGLGNSQGVPVVANNDCAERLWSVNAAVIGEDVYEGSDSTITRIDLLKRNTFYSQWCAPANGAPEFQVASVRPEVNLLLDPTDPNRQPVPEGAITGETRGRMQPYLNVSRSEFEKAEYEQGSTEELAGRGLYGDYALFIPRAVLNLDGRPGLRLDRIEDILLRLDYVSVARD